MYIASYKQLTVWQKAIELVKILYRVTDSLPKHELYCLSSQMRRAAISIPSNIAEGQQRKNLKEYLQFLRISYGSAAELETQIIIAKDLYPSTEFFAIESLLNEIQKMLNTIIHKLEAKS